MSAHDPSLRASLRIARRLHYTACSWVVSLLPGWPWQVSVVLPSGFALRPRRVFCDPLASATFPNGSSACVPVAQIRCTHRAGGALSDRISPRSLRSMDTRTRP